MTRRSRPFVVLVLLSLLWSSVAVPSQPVAALPQQPSVPTGPTLAIDADRPRPEKPAGVPSGSTGMTPAQGAAAGAAYESTHTANAFANLGFDQGERELIATHDQDYSDLGGELLTPIPIPPETDSIDIDVEVEVLAASSGPTDAYAGVGPSTTSQWERKILLGDRTEQITTIQRQNARMLIADVLPTPGPRFLHLKCEQGHAGNPNAGQCSYRNIRFYRDTPGWTRDRLDWYAPLESAVEVGIHTERRGMTPPSGNGAFLSFAQVPGISGEQVYRSPIVQLPVLQGPDKFTMDLRWARTVASTVLTTGGGFDVYFYPIDGNWDHFRQHLLHVPPGGTTPWTRTPTRDPGEYALSGPTGPYFSRIRGFFTIVKYPGTSGVTINGSVEYLEDILGIDTLRFFVNGQPVSLRGDQLVGPCDCDVGPNKRVQHHVAEPINSLYGAFYLQASDLAVPTSGMPLVFDRIYMARFATTAYPTTTLGSGWRHRYAEALSVAPPVWGTPPPLTATLALHLDLATGNRFTFARPTATTRQFDAPPGVYATLAQDTDGSFTLTTNDREVKRFDTQGRLIELQDAQGHTQSLAYATSGTGAGQLQSVTDDDTGQELTFAYSDVDPGSGTVVRLTSVEHTQEPDRDLAFTYTTTSDGALGHLKTVTDVRNGVTTYSYSGSTALMATVRYPGTTGGTPDLTNTYDGQGRVTQQVELSGLTTAFGYTTVGISPTTIITRTGPGLTTDVIIDHYRPDGTLQYQERNGIFLGYRTFSSSLQPAVVLNGQANVTRRDSTARGLPRRITSPTNATMTMQYTNSVDLRQTVTSDGITTSVIYDAQHQPTVIRTAAASGIQQTTAVTWTTDQRPETVITEDGLRTDYTYTTDGQIATMTVGADTADAQTTAYTYDSLGRVTHVTEAVSTTLERVTLTEYRLDNQVEKVTRNYAPPGTYDPDVPDENVWMEFGYDSRGRQIWTRGVDGHYRGFTHYDTAGRVDWTVQNPINGSGDPYQPTTPPTFDPAYPDRNVVTTYGHDALGRQTLVTQYGILTGTLNLGTMAFSQAISRTTRTEYDQLGRPMTVTLNYRPGLPMDTLPDVNLQRYTYYDGASNPIWQRDELGRWTKTEYDAASRPVRIIRNYENGVAGTVATANADWADPSDSDLITEYTYTAEGRLTTLLDNKVPGSMVVTDNRVTSYGYDTLGRQISVTENVTSTLNPGSGYNLTTMTSYPTTSDLVRGTQDPIGTWTSYLYDGQRRPVSTIQNCRTSGGVATAGPCTGSSTTERNVISETRYDALGRPFETENAHGIVTRTQYDRLDRVAWTIENVVEGQLPTDDRNVITTQGYDERGRLVRSTDADGNTSLSTYDDLNRVITATDATSRTTTMGYDGRGTQRWTEAPDGTVTVYLTDGVGRVVRTIRNYQNGTVDGGDDPDEDLTTTIGYDQGGRTVRTIADDGVVTAVSYDLQDRVVQVVENYVSEEECEELSVRPADCNVATQYSYDRMGNRLTITDARNKTRTFTYYVPGWKATETDARATDPGATASNFRQDWTYRKDGQVAEWDFPSQLGTALDYDYDELGRLIHRGPDTNGMISQDWTYDALGRLVTASEEGEWTPAKVLTHTYDLLDRVTGVSETGIGTVSYAYTPGGQRRQLSYPTSRTIDYRYFGDGQLRDVREGSTVLADYSYDAIGRLDTVLRNSSVISTTWGYDQVGRVTDLTTMASGNPISDFDYTINRVGQRTALTETVNGTTTTTGYTYDALGRLTEEQQTAPTTTSQAYTYDLAGNRTSVVQNGLTIQSRTYGSANQVTNSGWSYDGMGNLLSDGTTSYTYDDFNRLTQAGTQTYLYHGEHLFAIDDGTTTTRLVVDTVAPLSQALESRTGSTTTQFVYGLERITTIVGSTRTWDVADAQGSVHATLNSAGSIQTTQQFDAWGQSTGSSQPSPWGYTGEYQDPVTGLIYLRARWYNPAEGTLLGRDPFAGILTLPYSLHPYQYGYSNPLTNSDPSGQRVPCDEDNTCPPSVYEEMVQVYMQAISDSNDGLFYAWLDANPGAVIYLIPNAEMEILELFERNGWDSRAASACMSIMLGLWKESRHKAGTNVWNSPGGLIGGGAADFVFQMADGNSVASKMDGSYRAIKDLANPDNLPRTPRPDVDGTPNRIPATGDCSFPATTLVATPDGNKPIDEIQVGEFVYAYDEATQTTDAYTVTAVLIHDDPILIQVRLDEEWITTTPEHPFFTKEHGWVAAADLTTAMSVRKANGTFGAVHRVIARQQVMTMYNLTVDVAHTFFVGEQEWLVHNTCPRIQVGHGDTDLSKKAIQHRKDNNITGLKNVAVFEYIDDAGNSQYIAMESKMFVGHSERRIHRHLQSQGIKPDRVKRIYSELHPCGKQPGGHCDTFLRNNYPDAEVTYSFEYGDKASRDRGKAELQKSVDKIFGK